MTLGEALARARKMPEIGDHEIVVGPDGMAHLLIITSIEHATPGPSLAASLGFMCPCMVFPEGTDAPSLVIASHVTCLKCVSA